MTWDIITGLITMIGCLIALGTLLAKLISILTKLDNTLTQLQRELGEFKADNKESHKRIWGKLDNHDVRIQKLEDKSETKL